MKANIAMIQVALLQLVDLETSVGLPAQVAVAVAVVAAAAICSVQLEGDLWSFAPISAGGVRSWNSKLPPNAGHAWNTTSPNCLPHASPIDPAKAQTR